MKNPFVTFSDGPTPAQTGHRGAMAAAEIRAALQRLAETVAQERAGFDSAGRLPDDLYRSLAETRRPPRPTCLAAFLFRK